MVKNIHNYMKAFDKKSEVRVWISLIISIPFLFFVLWNESGVIGLREIIIAVLTFLIGVGILYFVKWYSNR